ncbi:precorrin-2 dehydrogenase/sirohydrochlorin ferrochelatase family protein [Desulfocicer niacini]
MSDIPYYPVHLNVKGKTCLVVGGGRVGIRKTRSLLKSGARVTMITPRISADHAGELTDKINWISAPYAPHHLKGVCLVFAATDQRELNHQIAQDAKKAGIPCNIADDPPASDFIVPAVVQRGDLILTVSTSGTSPAFAKKLRRDLESQFGEGYAEFLFLMGRIRNQLLAQGHAPEKHKILFSTLIKEDLPGMVMEKDIERINHLLGVTLGRSYTYQKLIAGDPS